MDFSWRLIDTGPLDGPANMAVDEALLASFDPERSRPVLRLYGWSPPALSLGRFQDAAGVLDLERCAAAGVPVVRRVTGGGTIFHADELTYAIVCAPHQIPPQTSVKDSFRVLTAFLLRFYLDLGLEAAHAVDLLPEGTRLGARTDFCFAGRESFDILVNGRKMGGNAQRRLKNTIFQHGSIPLWDRTAEGGLFLRRAPDLGDGVTCLTAQGVAAAAAALTERLAAAFAVTLDVGLERCGLTAAEAELAQRLRSEKYVDPAWNLAGRDERMT